MKALTKTYVLGKGCALSADGEFVTTSGKTAAPNAPRARKG